MKKYIAPQIKVVRFEVENGFAGTTLDQISFMAADNESTGNVEDYTQHDVWNNGDGFWN